MRASSFRRARALRRSGQRGMAMLLVIISIALMTVLVADFMENTSVFVATGTNARDEVQAVYLARSAINLSRLLLVVTPAINRQLRGFGMPNLPLWRYADMLLAAFADPGAAAGLGMMLGANLSDAEGLGAGDGTFSARIVDEDSRINLNMAAEGRMSGIIARELAALMAPAQYNELFEERDQDDHLTDREAQIGAIIDWVDLDTLPFGLDTGAEDTFYEMLRPAYVRRNAPFDSLEELRMVRGVDEDFWSAFVDPDPEDPEQRILTVWGAGRVNVNTATPMVIAAMICAFAQNQPEPACDPTNPLPAALMLSQFVVMYREAGGLLPGLGAFSSVNQFMGLVSDGVEGIVPGVPLNAREARRYLDVQSRVFSVYATGEVGRVRRTIHIVVHTGLESSEGGAILYWRED